MKIKEIIQGLVAESDMDSELYVRIEDEDGNESFVLVEGIATFGNSYKTSYTTTCTTLELSA